MVHPVSRIVGILFLMGGPKFDVVVNAFAIFVTSLLFVLGSPISFQFYIYKEAKLI